MSGNKTADIRVFSAAEQLEGWAALIPRLFPARRAKSSAKIVFELTGLTHVRRAGS
jgi:hypothetical protein